MLEAAGCPAPTFVNSIQQAPLEGVSMAYAFDDAQAAERHDDAVLRDVRQPRHLPPGLDRGHPAQHPLGTACQLPPFDDDVWELYGPDDWTQVAEHRRTRTRDSWRELQRLLLIEATKYNVLPLDDRRVERFNPDLAGRPQLIRGNTQLLFGGMGRLSENSVVSIKNKSHSVTAEVVVPEGGAKGVIIAQGGSVGGWSLYAKDGKLKYCYNFFGIDLTSSTADARRSRPARIRCAWSSPTTAAAWPRAARSRSTYDGQQVGEGRVETTQPMAFSADETCDVGREIGSPVSPDYGPQDNAFSGEVNWVQIDLEKDDHDHLISPEERFQVADGAAVASGLCRVW